MLGPLIALGVLLAGALFWVAWELRKVSAQVTVIQQSAVGRALLT